MKNDKPESLAYLSARQLQDLDITTADIIASIEHLIIGCSESRAWNAPKAVLKPPDGRYVMAMLSLADDPPYMAVKSLLLNPRNSARGLSDINSLITLHDSDTGLPLAVLDGNWITAVRTAGLSAVAARRLARPDSSVAAFIGCGVQARSHLQAFQALFPLTEIRAFGRGKKNIDALGRAAEKAHCDFVIAMSAEEAVSDADLIVSSVTLSPGVIPFINAKWLKTGSFSTVTDLGVSWISESLSLIDKIVIDDVEQEALMAEPMLDAGLVAGDLFDLVTGTLIGRHAESEKTAFVFRGLAIADLAVAALCYQRAMLA